MFSSFDNLSIAAEVGGVAITRESNTASGSPPNGSPNELKALFAVLLDGALLLVTVTRSILRAPWRFGTTLEPTLAELKRAFVYLIESIVVAVLILQILPPVPLPGASPEDLELLESDLLVEGLTIATAALITFSGVVAHYLARRAGSGAPLYGAVAVFLYYNGYLNVLFVVLVAIAAVVAPLAEGFAAMIVIGIVGLATTAWWIYSLAAIVGWFAQVTDLGLGSSTLICFVAFAATSLPAVGLVLMIQAV